MDQAWELEEEFWQAGASGRISEFYAKALTTDAFVVVPGQVLLREELLLLWHERAHWDRFELSHRREQLVNGETALLSYHIVASSLDTPDYQAHVSSLYTWIGGGWALVFRQHTPDPAVS